MTPAISRQNKVRRAYNRSAALVGIVMQESCKDTSNINLEGLALPVSPITGRGSGMTVGLGMHGFEMTSCMGCSGFRTAGCTSHSVQGCGVGVALAVLPTIPCGTKKAWPGPTVKVTF